MFEWRKCGCQVCLITETQRSFDNLELSGNVKKVAFPNFLNQDLVLSQVICYITMERSTMLFMGKSTKFLWPFSIAFCMFTRPGTFPKSRFPNAETNHRWLCQSGRFLGLKNGKAAVALGQRSRFCWVFHIYVRSMESILW